MKDKRKFKRYDSNVPFQVRIFPQSGFSEKIDFEGINISASGILIKKRQVLPENIPLMIEIMLNFEELKSPDNLEGELIMTVTGQVVRNNPDTIAIRFNEDCEISQRLSFL